jgi:hypothetical protein
MSRWAHSGIVVTAAGEVIGFTLDSWWRSTGAVSRSVRSGLTEGHGITLVRQGDDEYLWVSDPGFVFEVGSDDGDEEWATVFGKGVHVESRPPRVFKMTLGGEILAELPIPRPEPGSPPGMMGDHLGTRTRLPLIRRSSFGCLPSLSSDGPASPSRRRTTCPTGW